MTRRERRLLRALLVATRTALSLLRETKTAPAPEPEPAPRRARRRPASAVPAALNPREDDFLRVLREAGEPLQGKVICKRAQCTYNGTSRGYLSGLKAAGLVEHSDDGYEIADPDAPSILPGGGKNAAGQIAGAGNSAPKAIDAAEPHAAKNVAGPALKARVVEALRAGQYKGIEELAGAVRAAHVHVRAALDDLSRSGRIAYHAGKGYVVNEPAPRPTLATVAVDDPRAETVARNALTFLQRMSGGPAPWRTLAEVADGIKEKDKAVLAGILVELAEAGGVEADADFGFRYRGVATKAA